MSGLSERAASASSPDTAPEKSARLPAGRATVLVPAPVRPASSAEGTQKRARFPSGSGSLSLREGDTSGDLHGVEDAHRKSAVRHGTGRGRRVLEDRPSQSRSLGESH